jgi:hypothetical protein
VSNATTEERLARLEQLVERVIVLARQYPLGRKFLARLGVDDA